MSKSTVEETPITKADLLRFHKNAPAALARRNFWSFFDDIFAGIQLLFLGALPIYGSLFWDWPAEEMFLFLIVGTWAGILSAVAKFTFLKQEVVAYAEAKYDDWHVWVVAQALRNNETKALKQYLRAKWNPMGGIAVDFLMGGFSTILIISSLSSNGDLEFDSSQSKNILLWLAVICGIRFLTTLIEIVFVRASRSATKESAPIERETPAVKAVLGLRGIGLFLLVFLIVFVTEAELGSNSTKVAIITVNALVCLFGAISILSPLLLRGETNWLRQYLQGRDGQKDAEASMKPIE